MKILLSTLILMLLIPAYSQVGINTAQPHPDTYLDVNGKVRIQEMNILTEAKYVLVEGENQIVSRMSIANLNTHLCPQLSRSQSGGYYLKFYSNGSIANPTNNLVIQGLSFVSANAWIDNNIYYFTYSNTSGQPLNINNFTVNFSGLVCNYN